MGAGNTAVAKGAAAKQGSAKPRVAAIPFTHAAHENMEFMDSDAKVITARAQKLSNIDLPAKGYVRHVWTRWYGSGGTKGPAAVHEDFPFVVIDNVGFKDVGGGEITNPMTGHDLYCVNKYGGYVFSADPTLHPDYSDDGIAFNFSLRIPFEISASDGLGALSNQNSQSKYKFNASINDSGSIYSTLPTAEPTVNFDIYSELWSQPPGATGAGVPILNRPPLLGTTQYWVVERHDIASAGNKRIEIERRGNQIRTIIAIWRKSNGTRDDATYPQTAQFVWDSREQFEETAQYRRQIMTERFGSARTALDKGVYVYDFSHDVLGHPGGMDDGHLWLRTKSTSRLELRGDFTDSGVLTLLINDVAPVSVVDQYSDAGATGGAVDNTLA